MATNAKAGTAENSRDFYRRKLQQRKLSTSLENTTVKVGWQVSFGLAAALLLASYDLGKGTVSMGLVYIAAVYGLGGLLCLLVSARIKAGILSSRGEVSLPTRALGLLMLPFILTGNFFMTIAGLMLLKREKGIEYQLAVYSLLALLVSFVVSLLNLFKPRVVHSYYTGMNLIIWLMVFNLALMVAAGLWVKGRQVDKKIIPLAALSMLQIVFGNVFGLLYGLVILSKALHRDEEVSIEWVDIVRRLFKNYMAVIGMFIVVFLLMLSIVSTLTFDYQIAVDNDYGNILQPPSLSYPFGTDNYGRCVFTRIVFGARISLIVGLASTVIPILIGGVLGALAGYYAGSADNVIMRTLDVLYAVPATLLAIAIIAAFGASTVNLILALSIGWIPVYARTVRATVITLSGQEFVEAARACGAKNGLIIFKHIVPNSLAPVIVRATLGIGGAVLSTSSLSYLGMGVEPHIPEWGNILKVGSSYLETNPYIAIFPGLAIILIVLAFNFFGDGLRDALDPKLK